MAMTVLPLRNDFLKRDIHFVHKPQYFHSFLKAPLLHSAGQLMLLIHSAEAKLCQPTQL